MAKQDQQVLMAQKSQLERELARARITDFKDATVEQVSVGSVVEVRTRTAAPLRYTILGVWDGDPDHHVISYKTPLGAALIGKKLRRHGQGEDGRGRGLLLDRQHRPLRLRGPRGSGVALGGKSAPFGLP
jgi:hypothetical protein